MDFAASRQEEGALVSKGERGVPEIHCFLSICVTKFQYFHLTET